MIESIYDFLHYLIFGSDVAYLQKAMDPLTLAMMAGRGLLSAGSSFVQGQQAYNTAQEQAEAERLRAEQGLSESESIMGEAKEALGQYGVGPSYSDLRRIVMEDPTSDYLRREARRQEAGQLEALRSGGARALLGGTQAVAQGTMDNLAKIAAEEQQRKVAGLTAVGQAEQRVAEQKFLAGRDDLSFGRGLRSESLAAQFGAEDAVREADLARRTSGIQAGEALLGAGLDVAEEFFAKDGGVFRGKTPGEFSHKNNPIDIIQDGEKIGEMTGGEGVIPPQDLGKLEQLAGDGKSPLHKYVRGLIKKMRKNG